MKDVNSMTREELLAVKGIDEKLANAILQRRDSKVLTSVEDLREVPGMSERTLNELKQQGLVCLPRTLEQTGAFSCCCCGRTLQMSERCTTCSWYSNICKDCYKNVVGRRAWVARRPLRQRTGGCS